MNKLAYVLIAGLLLLAACTVEDPTQPDNNTNETQNIDQQAQDVQQYAEDWIRDQPTYAYDGQNLTLEEHRILESDPVQHVLVYTFTSTQAGYGDRSDQAAAQVITNHTIHLLIRNDTVESAIIDDRWNEVTQELLSGEPAEEPGIPTESQETVSLHFQPMQCENYSWDDWYTEGNVNYVTEPSTQQLVGNYYANEHGIPVEVERIDSDMMTCQACNTCPQSYRLQATVETAFADTLEADGWSNSTQ